MSISTNQPVSTEPKGLTPTQQRTITAVAVVALVACPILIALPPRKLDVYTLGLVGAWGVGANELTREYTGRSVVMRIQERVEVQRQEGLRQRELEDLKEKERRDVLGTVGLRSDDRSRVSSMMKTNLGSGWETTADLKGKSAIADEVRRQNLEKEQQEEERSLLQKVWFGGEKSNWKKERDKREKEALEQGKGYGDLISDQIWEVWNWGKDKVEEVKKADEKVMDENNEKKPEAEQAEKR
ncbi:hypothetical protein BGZ60DRAFT_429898 [Tricladium varicosporioides]|nr:hypothetical protein BGZ60DRAFT_429898 [Hymenoscyphus varicosporioides]